MKKVQRIVACVIALVLVINIKVMNADAAKNDNFITRGQLAALINQTLKVKADKPKQSFIDVPVSDPNAKDIAIAVTAGYMKGVTGNHFLPQSRVTGPQLAVIACHLLSWRGIEPSGSIADVPAWAAPYYAALDDFGVLDDLGLTVHEVTMEQAEHFITTLSYVMHATANNPYGARQVSLKDDFYLYTNRKYVANPIIQPGNAIAATFYDVAIKADNARSEIMTQLLRNKTTAANGSPEWRAAELYTMYTDSTARNGIDQLRPYLNELYAVQDAADLSVIAKKYSSQFNFTPFIGMMLVKDSFGDPNRYAVSFIDKGLGLGTPLYYSDTPSTAPVQQAYLKYIERVLSYCGIADHLPERAQAILELEKQLAAKVPPPEQMQDPKIFYTRTTWDEMKKATPHSKLAENVVQVYSLPADMSVYSPELDYIRFADSLITNRNLQAIKDLLTVNAFQQYKSAFSEKAQDFDNDLTRTIMGTLPEKLPIEQRAAAFTQSMEPQVFDKMYVNKYFPESSKNDVKDMVSEIIAKYEARIRNLTWMSAQTKEKAIEKLKDISVNIGYPDEWNPDIPYSFRSKQQGGTVFEALISLNVVREAAVKEQLKKPYAVKAWDVAPVMEVNAFYNPFANSIVFPAAILQEPFYDSKASREHNLGGIGAIIGHEISHAFDVNGAQFDKDGNMTNWWTDADYDKFHHLTEKMAEQLSSIELIPGNKVNGQQTLAETIADLGGLSCVLDIADDNPNADLTQLFESYAHNFASWMPVETVIYFMQMDPHAPDKVRVNFVMQMVDQFYNVYHITSKDAMYLPPDKRISIW